MQVHPGLAACPVVTSCGQRFGCDRARMAWCHVTHKELNPNGLQETGTKTATEPMWLGTESLTINTASLHYDMVLCLRCQFPKYPVLSQPWLHNHLAIGSIRPHKADQFVLYIVRWTWVIRDLWIVNERKDLPNSSELQD